MEDGRVSISRAKGTVTYPAQFLLIAASNPCPCGYYGSKKRACKCMPGAIRRYNQRISGPILDRVDIHVDVPSVETQKLVGKESSKKGSSSNRKIKTSKEIQKRVQKARDVQTKRFKNKGIKSRC